MCIRDSHIASEEETLELLQVNRKSGLLSDVPLQQSEYTLYSTRSQLPALDKEIAGTLSRIALLTGTIPGFLDQKLRTPDVYKRQVLTYTVMGLVGLPVFASGGGPSYILQPTFGYLVAFMLQAYVGGTYIRRSGPITFKKQLTAHLIGLVIVYTVGIAYFYAVSRYLLQSTMTFGVMLWYCAVLQIVPDLVICAVAALIGERAYRIGLWIK